MSRLGVLPSLSAVGLVILGIHATPLSAQVVRGTVVHEEDGSPVAFATVQLSRVGGKVNARAVTDGAGRFRLRPYPRGEYELSVEHVNVRGNVGPPLALMPEDTFTVVVGIPRGVEGSPVLHVVSHTRSQRLESVGYYRRSLSGPGTHIGPGLIGARNWLSTGSLLSSPRVRTLIKTRSPFSNFAFRAFAEFRPADTFGEVYGGGCLSTVFVNGMRYGPAYRDVVDRVAPEEIEGIEIYPADWSVPPEYATKGSSCGAMLIWLRR